MLALLPAASPGDVIDISDVNADRPDGYPLLYLQVVTVKGVVTVETGVLSANTNIYIQDATGGVNVIQRNPETASPVVAVGDSVLVTGLVDVETGRRTYLLVSPTLVPGSRMEVTSSGNAVPPPVVLSARDVALNGEEYEGSYAVVRRASLLYPQYWPSGGCTQDIGTYIADGDTFCFIWLDKDTDVCGSPPPLSEFDVCGVIVPNPNPLGPTGNGILAPTRADVRSRGSGSGFATVDPERVYAGEEVELEFTLSGEADTLTQVTIEIPDGWAFSGDVGDVTLEGAGFASASVDEGETTPDLVAIDDCSLVHGVGGTVTIEDLTTPGAAGAYAFTVATAIADGELTGIQESPEVTVGALADPGTVLINEVYAYGKDSTDRSEFIELHNPGETEVSLSGWVLTDMDKSANCKGSNLWEFPEGASIAPGGYVTVAKDARMSASQGFEPVFGTYPDYELVDTDYNDVDSPNAPNLTLVSPTDGTKTSSQEIRLIGGSDGNGVNVAKIPSYEAVFLYSDRTLAALVDAMEYRDPIYWSEDACPGGGELGGPDDAWVPGPPPKHYSLGRDTLATDTNVSRDDFILSSEPTPGAVNKPYDDLPPKLTDMDSAGDTFVKVIFNEPLDEDSATDIGNYSIDGRLEIHNAWLSRDGRTVLLETDGQVIDQSYTLAVAGVTDLAENEMEEDSDSFLGYFDEITPISEVQAYDDQGYSPLWGEAVVSVGFTTVPPGVFSPDRTNMYMQSHGAGASGVNVYSGSILPNPPVEGDLIKVAGDVTEYRSIDYDNPFATPPGATTEIANAVVTILARGFDVVEPAVLPTGEVGREYNEGVLVRTSGVVFSLEAFAFYIDDGSGSVQVYQNFSDLDFGEYAIGDSVEVTGVVLQYDRTKPYLGGYELAPRYASDMVVRSTHYAGEAAIDLTAVRVLDIDEDESIGISYNAPRGANVAVRVFDLKGRSIATLYDGFCLGPQRASWDGRDDNGAKVPPGVYICHIQAKERQSGDVTDAAVPIVVGMKLE